MTMVKSQDEQIFIGDNDMVVELLGEAKAEFIAMREEMKAEQTILEAEQLAKQQKRIDAITKLGEASGLTTDEINSILNI
jgi:hypothetical protein